MTELAWSTMPLSGLSSTLINWPEGIPQDEGQDAPVLVRLQNGTSLQTAQLRPTSSTTGLLVLQGPDASRVQEVRPIPDVEAAQMRHEALLLVAASPAGAMLRAAMEGDAWPELLAERLPRVGIHPGELRVDGHSLRAGPLFCTIRLHGIGFAVELAAQVFPDGSAEVSVAALRNAHELTLLPDEQDELDADSVLTNAPLPQRIRMFGQTLPWPKPSLYLPCSVTAFGVPRRLLENSRPIPESAVDSKDGGMTGGAGICPLGTWDGAPANLDSACKWLALKGTRAVFHEGRALSCSDAVVDLTDAYTFSDLDQGHRIHGWKKGGKPGLAQKTPWPAAAAAGALREFPQVLHCPPGLQWIVRTYGMLAHLAECGHYPALEALAALRDTLVVAIDEKVEPLGRGVGWLLGLYAATRRLHTHGGGAVGYKLLHRIKASEYFLHTELGHKDCDLFGASKLTHSIGSPWESAIVLLGIAAAINAQGHTSWMEEDSVWVGAIRACLRDITLAWSGKAMPGDRRPTGLTAGQKTENDTWAYKILFLQDELRGRYFGAPSDQKPNRDAELYMPAAIAEGLSMLRQAKLPFGSLEFDAADQLEQFLIRWGGSDLGTDMVARADAYFDASRGKAQHGWALVCAMAVRRLAGTV